MITIDKQSIIDAVKKEIASKVWATRRLAIIASPQDMTADEAAAIESIARSALRAVARALPEVTKQHFSWQKPEYWEVEKILREHLLECQLYRQLKELANEEEQQA